MLRILEILQIHDIEAVGGFDLENIIFLHTFLTAELVILFIYDLFLGIVGDLRNIKLILKLDRFCQFPHPVGDPVTEDKEAVILP